MRIEQISEERLSKVSESELKSLRFRFIQLWEKNFKGTDKQQVGSLDRKDFVKRYKLLIKIMAQRGIYPQTASSLDKYIFDSAMYKFSVPNLGDIVVVPDYCSLAGSYIRNPKTAKDADIVLRSPEEQRDETLELKLGRVLSKLVEKDMEFIYHAAGPHSSYIPIYDLILRPKDTMQIIKVKETKITKEKLAAEEERSKEYDYYHSLDQWDEVRISDAAAIVKELDPGSILDLGCGSGYFISLLQSGGRKVFGVDSSEVAISLAKGRNIEVMEHDLDEALPFKNNSFDNVIAFHTLEHLEKPEVLISEAQRIALEKAIILCPLGDRFCPDHKQSFKELKDFKKLFPEEDWKVEELQYAVGVAVYEKPERLKKAALKPLQRFKPTKFAPATGYTESEFFDIEKWSDWAKDYLKEGIALEMKYNGYHSVLEIDENKKSLIYFEDTMEDKSSIFPDLVEELKLVGKTVILDADIGMRSKKGELLPRVDLAILAQTKDEISGWWKHPKRTMPEAKLEVHVYDCLYYNGKDIHDEEFHVRRKILEQIFGAHDFKYLQLSPVYIVKNKKDFISRARKLSALQGSEGAVAKWINFKYPIYPKTTPATSKFKKSLEVKFQVLKVIPTKTPGTVNLRIAYRDNSELIDAGKTFNTKLKAKIGDIVTVTVDEVIPMKEKDKWKLGFVSPAVQDLEVAWKRAEDRSSILRRASLKGILQANEEVRRELGMKKTTEKELIEWKDLTAFDKQREGVGGEFGNIDFDIGVKGEAVLQLHIMGIEEDKIEDLKKISKRALIARLDLHKLERLLKDTIGEQGAHFDLRLRPSGAGYWEGGEIMIGNLSGISKLADYKEGDKLRFAWKQSRAGEKKTVVVRGPLSWMSAGARTIEIFAPGEVGALAKTYGAMITVDKMKWEIYIADKHAKKIRFKDRYLTGNWLFAYVPVTAAGKKGKRVWMVSKLKEEKTEKQILNSPTLAYKAVYGKLPSKSLRGRTQFPKKMWRGIEVDAHLKSEWLEQLNNIKGIEIRSTDEGKSKERVAFVVLRMKDSENDNKAEAISESLNKMEGLYSLCDIGTEKRSRIVVAGKVIYGQNDWKEWWNSLAEKIEKALSSIMKLDIERPGAGEKVIKKEVFFPIFKVSEDEQIVGGVVYEPMKEDAQKDYATAEEIKEACYYYMENARQFKIQHKGKFITDKIKILENYIAPEDFTIDKQKVKKGTWIMIIRILDKNIWKDIKEERISGFSMAGIGRRRKVKNIST